MANPTSQASAWSVESTLESLNLRPVHSATTAESPIPFLHLIERLKTTPREGWRRFSITPGESISDHMYRMSIITMLAPTLLTDASPPLDTARCIQMALIHDMAESLVGDITPVDGVSKEEKSRRELATMEYLARHSDMLGSYDRGRAGERMLSLWKEYEDGLTPEALFVKDVDKVELLLQMVEYERRGGGRVDLSEFIWVADRIAGAQVKAWAAELLAERKDFWLNQLQRRPTSLGAE